MLVRRGRVIDKDLRDLIYGWRIGWHCGKEEKKIDDDHYNKIINGTFTNEEMVNSCSRWNHIKVHKIVKTVKLVPHPCVNPKEEE